MSNFENGGWGGRSTHASAHTKLLVWLQLKFQMWHRPPIKLPWIKTEPSVGKGGWLDSAKGKLPRDPAEVELASEADKTGALARAPELGC